LVCIRIVLRRRTRRIELRFFRFGLLRAFFDVVDVYLEVRLATERIVGPGIEHVSHLLHPVERFELFVVWPRVIDRHFTVQRVFGTLIRYNL
jgi:hypothetical protein